jgi:hypothetical protein
MFWDVKLADSQTSNSAWVFGLVEWKTHCHLRLYLDCASKPFTFEYRFRKSDSPLIRWEDLFGNCASEPLTRDVGWLSLLIK